MSRRKFQFKPEEATSGDAIQKSTLFDNIKKKVVPAVTITIDEPKITKEPFPYFYHTWNKELFCNIDDTSKIFNIQNLPDEKNVYIYNNNLPGEECNNFKSQHDKYANSLQNYYYVVDKTEPLPGDWDKSKEIEITKITPIYVQKCDNIMSTLLFMPLDQCHDFRGGRTSGGKSLATQMDKGKINTTSKNNENGLANNGGIITGNIYSNTFINNLVNTSFSGQKNIIGLLVIGNDSVEILKNSEFMTAEEQDKYILDVQKIMDNFDKQSLYVNVSSEINMYCQDKGNKQEIDVNGKTAYVTFLGFPADGWDKGMHSIWTMNEIKHIYYVAIDSIDKNINPNKVNYSGDKITTLENIVPSFEMLFSNTDSLNNFMDIFMKDYKYDTDEIFEEANFNMLYDNFLKELYTSKTDDISVDEYADDDAEQSGGINEEMEVSDNIDNNTSENLKILRGANYKIYGVRELPSDKQNINPVIKNNIKLYSDIFIEILKKMSKSISPEIHPNFQYSTTSHYDENMSMNDRIKNVNELFKQSEIDIFKIYNQQNSQIENINNSCNNITAEKYIIKQFGNVNDMNILPKIDNVMNSLNCSDNCSISNKSEFKKTSDNVNENIISEENVNDDTPDSEIIKQPCQQRIEDYMKDIDNYYPYKFQIVSGVVDSSKLGGENMPEFFPPEIDIFMTIFDNDGNLTGAIVRMTFLKQVLKNALNKKNGASVYSHFIYVDFDEIDTNSSMPDEWQKNSDTYSLALRNLLNYVIDKTVFLPSLSDNFLSNFELILKDNVQRKRWFFYLSDNAGPSVADGINSYCKNDSLAKLDDINKDTINISETIIRIAQKIYSDPLNSKLRDIFVQESINRSYIFESMFLYKIKYIGDKSRCTDALFLNKNKFAECLQITGDENAHFTALMNGASSVYSPPSKFCLYLTPYFTYGNVNNNETSNLNGKFLINLPIYKKLLLKGESPSDKGADPKTKESKSAFEDNIIQYNHKLFKDRKYSKISPLSLIDDYKKTSKYEILKRLLLQAHNKANDAYKNRDEVDESKKLFNDAFNAIKKYRADYNDFNDIISNIFKTTNEFFNNPNVKKELNGIKGVFDNIISNIDYDKILNDITNDLSRIIAGNELAKPINALNNSFNEIKNYFIQQTNPSQKILEKLNKVNNIDELYNVLADNYNDLQTGKEQADALILLTDINKLLNTLNTIKQEQVKEDKKFNEYNDFFNQIININETVNPSKKRKTTSTPKTTIESITSTEIPSETPTDAPVFAYSKPIKKFKIEKQTAGGLEFYEESYKNNQIYILKCFAKLINKNNEANIKYINQDKTNFNYQTINDINSYCVTILMLQIYKSFTAYTPKINSINDINNKISKLNKTSTLQDAINIRNYYSPIIDTFVEMEYMQISVIDYVLGLYGIEVSDNETILYNLKYWCDSSYYVMLYIIDNIKSLNSPAQKFLNQIDMTNFYAITQIYNILDNIDIDELSMYYGLRNYKKDLPFLLEDNKVDIDIYLNIIDNYERLSLFLIKYCNTLLSTITNNQLTYSSNGLIVDFKHITEQLESEGLIQLVDFYNNLQINTNNGEELSYKIEEIKDIEETNDFNYLINTANLIKSSGESQNLIEPVKKSDITQVDKFQFKPMIPSLTSTLTTPSSVISAAGGSSLKHRRKIKGKTKNNKKKNKCVTRKKKILKIKRNTKRR